MKRRKQRSAYLTALRLRREERERWRREYEEKQKRQALAKKREEREERRRIFVTNITHTLTEIENLQAVLARFSSDQENDDEFSRMIQWAREHIRLLEQQLERSHLNASLEQSNLFPVVDDLDA